MRLFILFFFSLPAFAAPHFQAKMLEGKRPKKEASQWTLGDWLAQKNKIAFWDHWLAMNRQATMYEFNLGASHSRYELKTMPAFGVITKENQESQRYDLDFYVTIFNLFGEYEKTSAGAESYGGGLGFRIFGTSSQTTNIVLKFGWRKLTELDTGEHWENTFAESALQLYLVSFMGFEGKYRLIFPSDSSLGTKMGGTRVTGGVFFEAMIFRIFANYYQEPLRLVDSSGAVSDQQREGYDAGIRLFF